MSPVRVALSNDYEVVLHGLAAMLADRDEVEVVALTTSPHIDADVDLILFDTFGRLPADDAKLREMVASNDAKVVVYSFGSYSPDQARRQGAAGFIHKGLNGAHLAQAVVALHEGRAWESETPDARRGGRDPVAGAGLRPVGAGVGDDQLHRPRTDQPADRGAVLPEHQHGQDQHPHRLPQDRGVPAVPGRAVGPAQRVRHR